MGVVEVIALAAALGAAGSAAYQGREQTKQQKESMKKQEDMQKRAEQEAISQKISSSLNMAQEQKKNIVDVDAIAGQSVASPLATSRKKFDQGLLGLSKTSLLGE